MGALVAGYPSYSAGPERHLFRHPGRDEWHLAHEPFDPTVPGWLATIAAAGGPVPTGARAWLVCDGAKWDEREVTAREVA
jgi:hypothetical protein